MTPVNSGQLAAISSQLSAVSSQQASLAPDWPGNFWWHLIVFSAILIGFVLVMVLAFVWIERRGMGRMQARLGPNRCGPFGLMQSMADALKVLLKEDIVPLPADKIVHL